jgi:hypothetical protein
MESIKNKNGNYSSLKLYKYWGYFYIITGIILTVLGYVENNEYSYFNYSYIIFGILAIASYFILIKRINPYFFINCDEEKIEYYLPKQKKSETIFISDINEIEIKSVSIIIKTKHEEKTLSLGELPYSDVIKIKDTLMLIKRA